MRFVHILPSLGGDAETSEVSRHGTHNLLRKISTIYSARRPYFASHGVLAMRFIKKRGFPAWQANFVKQGF
jgi:hypothetical protein